MVRSKWHRNLAISIVVFIVAAVFIVALSRSGLLRVISRQNSSIADLDLSQRYYADVYKYLALRKDGFLNSQVLEMIDTGSELQVLENTNKYMVKVKTSSGRIGYVRAEYLTASGSPAKVFNKENISVLADNVYYISRADSVAVYRQISSDMTINDAIGFVLRWTPVQIVSAYDDETFKIVDCESGMQGYVIDAKNLFATGYEGTNTPNNKTIGNGRQTGVDFEYPLNTLQLVYTYEDADEKSKVVATIYPGGWVNITDSKTKNGFVKVDPVFWKGHEGYIRADLIFSIP